MALEGQVRDKRARSVGNNAELVLLLTKQQELYFSCFRIITLEKQNQCGCAGINVVASSLTLFCLEIVKSKTQLLKTEEETDTDNVTQSLKAAPCSTVRPRKPFSLVGWVQPSFWFRGSNFMQSLWPGQQSSSESLPQEPWLLAWNPTLPRAADGTRELQKQPLNLHTLLALFPWLHAPHRRCAPRNGTQVS